MHAIDDDDDDSARRGVIVRRGLWGHDGGRYYLREREGGGYCTFSTYFLSRNMKKN